MTALTPEENALVAYALLDEVNSMLANGARVEGITRDIARAQVYATLATRRVPEVETIAAAIQEGMEATGYYPGVEGCKAAAEAVRGLL